MMPFDLQNLDLYTVGAAIAISMTLGFVVYLSNKKSITNKFFLLFAFVSCVWGVFNYLVYQLTDPVLNLATIRIVMFCAVWQAFSFFLLSYVFPKTDYKFPKAIKYLFFLVLFVAVLTQTPYIFSSVVPEESGLVPKAIPGPGIVAFGLLAVALVIAGIAELIRKRIKAVNLERKQYNMLLIGVMLMFILIVGFNFLNPVLLGNPDFIPYSSVFIFPFLACTSYAILKHKLLNTKVVATEIFTLLMVLVTFVEVLVSKSWDEIILRSFIFVALIGMSLLLIKSVRQEIEQREQLQILTTQLESANEQLKALDKARAEFISIASHQLRTPPATIKWYLAAVTAGDFGKVPVKIADAVRRAEVTNNGLISLIDDLLNVSRIERGKMEFLFEKADFSALVQAATDQLQPQAAVKKLKLTYVKPKTKLPLITADKEKLQQVVNNLIDNAIKYTKQGSITVKLAKDGGDLLLTVKDTGKGMSKEEIAEVFEKYGRGKNSMQHAAGLGLGMYVAKVVVVHHDGKVWGESAGEGLGSTFCVRIPLKSSLVVEKQEVDLIKELK